jgi:hypothetical protein
LKATLRAVLLDPEARNPVFANNLSHGKLREPLLRIAALLARLPSGATARTGQSLLHRSNWNHGISIPCAVADGI